MIRAIWDDKADEGWRSYVDTVRAALPPSSDLIDRIELLAGLLVHDVLVSALKAHHDEETALRTAHELAISSVETSVKWAQTLLRVARLDEDPPAGTA